MIYSEYGSTGYKVSAIGCGGMRFTDPQDIEANAELVKSAYDSGINYFDSAPGYCADKSEEIFGTAIREMLKTRQERPFYISTKTMQTTPSGVRENVEKSLKLLNVDCIDFYHCWCILNLDAYKERKENGVLKEFEKLREEGLVKHITVSSHMTGTNIDKMLNDYPFEGILLGYSAMNFAYRDAGIETASKLNLGVVVMNPLGGGIIPQNPDKFAFVKTQQNETVVQGALRFLINDPRINVALVGFSNQHELKEAINAVDGFKPLSSEQVDGIRGGIKESFNELCTGCQYCDKCPQGLPVPKLMDSFNHFLMSSDPAVMINRLKWHWGISLEDNYLGKCTKCGACEQACTQHLPILQRFEKMRSETDE